MNPAPISAHDIRMLVRERLTAGDTDAQTIQAVVNRYGAFVLLKPPVEPATYVLWFGPPGWFWLGLLGTRDLAAPAAGRSGRGRAAQSGGKPPAGRIAKG